MRVPNPRGEGQVEATFRRHGDHGDAVIVHGRRIEVGWIRYEEGECEGDIAKLPYSDIKPG